MYVFDAIMNRRSVIKFQDKPVEDKLIGLILYMATQAPSAGNSQDWIFIVVKDEVKRKELSAAALHQRFVAEAPVDIVVCADLQKISLRYGERGEKLYAYQDTAAAIQNILLSAHALDLGSCWVGSFDEDKVRTDLMLPEFFRPVAIIPIGYPAEKPEAPERIPFENLTYLNYFRGRYEFNFKTLEEYFRDALEMIKKPQKRTTKRPAKKIKLEDVIKRLIK